MLAVGAEPRPDARPPPAYFAPHAFFRVAHVEGDEGRYRHRGVALSLKVAARRAGYARQRVVGVHGVVLGGLVDGGLKRGEAVASGHDEQGFRARKKLFHFRRVLGEVGRRYEPGEVRSRVAGRFEHSFFQQAVSHFRSFFRGPRPGTMVSADRKYITVR